MPATVTATTRIDLVQALAPSRLGIAGSASDSAMQCCSGLDCSCPDVPCPSPSCSTWSLVTAQHRPVLPTLLPQLHLCGLCSRTAWTARRSLAAAAGGAGLGKTAMPRACSPVSGPAVRPLGLLGPWLVRAELLVRPRGLAHPGGRQRTRRLRAGPQAHALPSSLGSISQRHRGSGTQGCRSALCRTPSLPRGAAAVPGQPALSALGTRHSAEQARVIGGGGECVWAALPSRSRLPKPPGSARLQRRFRCLRWRGKARAGFIVGGERSLSVDDLVDIFKLYAHS